MNKAKLFKRIYTILYYIMPRNQTTKSTLESSKKEKQPPVEEQEDDVEEVEADDVEEEVEEVEDVEETKKSKKTELSFDSSDDALSKLLELDSEIEQAIKTRKIVFKQYQKLMQKQLKQSSKKRRNNNSDNPKEATGFVKAKPVPDKFKTFYNKYLKSSQSFKEAFPKFDISVDNPRTEITRIIYNYIKTNNLYNKNDDGAFNKREIKPDEAVRELFSIDTNDTIVFNNFQTYVSRLYNSNQEASGEESEDVQEKTVKTKGKESFKPSVRR